MTATPTKGDRYVVTDVRKISGGGEHRMVYVVEITDVLTDQPVSTVKYRCVNVLVNDGPPERGAVRPDTIRGESTLRGVAHVLETGEWRPAAVPQFPEDVRPTLEEQVLDCVIGEVKAQLEELSDDTHGMCNAAGDEHYDRLAALADDLRETLIVTVRQRVSDWVCDTEGAEVLYGTEWHKAIA